MHYAMENGTGWVRQPEDKRDYPLRSAFGLIGDGQYDVNTMKGVFVDIYNQTVTNSCVGHIYASAVQALELMAGLPYDPISRRYLYYYARRQVSKYISDGGCYMRSAAIALLSLGVPSEKYFDWDVELINQKPNFKAHMMAFSRTRGGEYAFIQRKGDDLIREIMASIDAGYPVGFGTAISRDFQNFEGKGIIEKPKETHGYHALLIVGYDKTGDKVVFDILNSYGRKFGDNGFCKMDEEYITWIESGDFVAIRGWNRLKKAKKGIIK